MNVAPQEGPVSEAQSLALSAVRGLPQSLSSAGHTGGRARQSSPCYVLILEDISEEETRPLAVIGTKINSNLVSLFFFCVCLICKAMFHARE